MTPPETKSRDGGDVPLSHSLANSLAGFVNDLKGLKADLHAKLDTQENRLTMLDQKMMAARVRPALSSEPIEAPHQKAFDAYVRNGDEDALRALDFESKALSSAVASDGGYLVDPATSESIQSVLQSSASLRAISTLVNVDATSYDVLVDRGELGFGWATEAAATSETATPTIERISIPLHELSALPKASQRLLDDAAFDIEAWLAGRIAERFSRAEAAAFISGNGVDKPTGFLSHPQIDEPSWSWGNIGYVPTGVPGALGDADALVNLVYALGAEYRANGTFVMNSKTAGAVRKLKDADGRFLWSDGLAANEPARLLGYSVLVAEDMPDISADSYSIAFGDFAAGYTIAERPDLRILRDPFSANPNVLFYATKRVGGDVSDFAAIKLLKFGVS